MMRPRITLELTAHDEGGEVQLFLNEEGLKLLMSKLRTLSRDNDHFHLFAPEWGAPEEPLSLKAYKEGACTARHFKVLFRPDDWDRQYYPHLFETERSANNDN